MRLWELYLVVSIVSLIVGLMLFLWAFETAEPIQIEQEGGVITTSFDATFIGLMIAGALFLGVFFGLSMVISTVRKLEKEGRVTEQP